MGATPVCLITAAGIQRPDFATVLNYFQTLFRSIYGQDVYLGADCQDGQFMSLLANAVHDCNGETEGSYNSFSPSTAQGAGLSSLVKINGIRRKEASYSTCDFLVVGQVNAQITAGVLRDAAQNTWALGDFVIPAAGQLTVTGTCQTLGAVALAPGALSTLAGRGSIGNPQLGWQSAINLSAAALGQPVETDSQLRQRQALSVGLPAQTVLEGLIGALYALTGVTRIRAYENDTPVVDTRTGAPDHTVTLVIEGGDTAQIANTIALKKSPGVAAYGNVITSVFNSYGVPINIGFFRPQVLPITWQVRVRAKAGYTLDVATAIKYALANYTSSVSIGANQELSSAYSIAGLSGDPRSSTFEVVGLQALRRNGGSDAYGDVQAAFNEAPTCSISDVTVTSI